MMDKFAVWRCLLRPPLNPSASHTPSITLHHFVKAVSKAVEGQVWEDICHSGSQQSIDWDAPSCEVYDSCPATPLPAIALLTTEKTE